ncbi:hypothetical protein ACFC1R_35960 [Kitasatospora sp. NPDC056138]|uniref:hypothetical protein n=1 Tax=Kitasatospora sp. NPDC056138 TaxID=3345724 RepID=UPI0035D77EFD
MNDIPQGGSGGVPGQHDSDGDHQQTPDKQEQGVKTVRAGAPVAEQKTDGTKADRDSADQDQAAADRTDE